MDVIVERSRCAALVKSHSWSTVKVDRNGLQFFYKHVLDKDWKWVDIVKVPRKKILPDILSISAIERLVSESGTMRRRRMEGEDFLKLILQHVLPKRFRRARDYGFLHGNAKRLLRIIQWALQLAHPIPKRRERACFICPHCQSPMRVTAFFKPGAKPG